MQFSLILLPISDFYTFLNKNKFKMKNLVATFLFLASIIIIRILYMSRAMRKCVLCHMRTTNAQIRLRGSAPLLFAA